MDAENIELQSREELDEALILAWVRLTGSLKNTRITQGMIYNEAIVMLLAYNRYRKDGVGLISFKEIVNETKMLKSLANRTIDSLVTQGFLRRCEGKDRRMTFVCPVKEKLEEYLAVHRRTLALVNGIVDELGTEDAETFVRIANRIAAVNPLEE